MHEYRCRVTEEPVGNFWPVLDEHYELCNPSWGNCPAGSFCGAPRDKGIPWDEQEINNAAFNYGITGFDNIQTSIFTILQCLTGEGWIDMLYMTRNYISETLIVVYFTSLMLFLSFFAFNLFVAVLGDSYESVTEADKN